MKLVKAASGKQTVKISKREWQGFGKTAGWMQEDQNPQELREDDPLSADQYDKNANEFMATRQNQDPSQPSFAVDVRSPDYPIPLTPRGRANKTLSEIGRKYWKEFPLDEIFNACESNGIIPIQEDGTEWGGMIGSQGECGHDKPSMKIALAIDVGEGFVPAYNQLIVTACTLPRGSIEIVSYIS